MQQDRKQLIANNWLGTVHDRLDGHFIPEVAIHSQVRCRGVWSHAITKVAQPTQSSAKQC
jgi:hypothetical protein